MTTPSPEKPLRILLADDHLVVRMGIAALISFEKKMTVVGEATDGQEAVNLVAELKPDVVLMDLMMPVLNGAEATQAIHAAYPNAKIVLLTSFGTSADIARAVNAGASGALLKSSSRDEIIAAICKVADGGRVFSPEIEGTLLHVPATPVLSARQIEVLGLAAKGFSNMDIARILGISVNSVKDHFKLIFSRLNVSTRAEATALALNLGLITG